MAINPTEFANVQLTDDFNTWRTRTNKTLAAFSANTITTANTLYANGTAKALTFGHAVLRGTLSANQLYANSYLSGGEFGNPDTLTITTNNYTYGKLTVANNATIGLDGEDELFSKARLRVTANATFRDIVRMDANVFIGTANTDTLVVNAVSTFDGEATFRDDVTVTANVSVTGDSVNITGNTVIGSANTDTLVINATTDINGTTRLNGSTTIIGDATGDDVTFTARVASSFVPKTDGVHTLGTTSLRWEELFVDSVTAGNAALSGTLDVDGATTLNGNITLGNANTDTVTINGTSELNGATTIDGATTITGEATINGNTTIGTANTDTLTVESGSTFNATSEFKGNVTVQGKAAFNGNTTIDGALSLGSGFVLSATEGIYDRLVVNEHTTIGSSNTDVLRLRATVNTSIIPTVTGIKDLGSSTLQWNNLWIDGTAEIDTLSLNGTTVTSTAAEINILNGVTATASELNILDGVTATTGELNILDGVTATASELNRMDGITATTTELNYTDGVTSNIQTQLNAKLNLSGGTMSGNTIVEGIRPKTDDTYDLGSAGHQFRNAYIDGTAYIDTLDLNGTSVTSTAAEINTLDGFTGTVADLNYAKDLRATGVTSTEFNTALDGITATAAELNTMDGITATTAELNKLDGYTGSVTELNYLDTLHATGVTSTEFDYLDGVTSNIQTQLNAKLNLSGGTLTGTLTSRSIVPSSGSSYDIGSSGVKFRNFYASGQFFGTATNAKYADLAEKYIADADYDEGTVIVVGGEAEVTSSTEETKHSVLGVVSSSPAFKMNSELENGTYIALKGRVPVKILGEVSKGDRLVATDNGCAKTTRSSEWTFAIALEDGTDGTIEAVIL